MQFENCTVYDKQALLTLNRLEGKGPQKWSILAQRLVVALVGVGILPYGVMRMRRGQNGGIALLVGVLCLALAVFHDHVNTWMTKRGMTRGEETNEFLFEDNFFFEKNRVGKMSHRYAEICALYHYRGYFFLVTDKKHTVMLKKSGFLEQSPEQFRAFIEEKTGKKMEDVQ